MDLSGKLLIAMPGMGDPRFEKSVVFMCVHSPDSAMGLIVNKPASELSFRQLLRQLDIPVGDSAREIRVHFGGPVEHGRGFVLHTDDYKSANMSLDIAGGFRMTATLDILEAIATGDGPRSSILALGYSGWGPGQLESEILANGWLTADATPDLVFGPDDGTKWSRALRAIGIDPLLLSATAGRA